MPRQEPQDAIDASAAALLDRLGIAYEPEAPLGPRTWYGIGGRAEALAHPDSLEALAALAARCHDTTIPLRVLGRGANLLVREGTVPGIVVALDRPWFTEVREDGNRVHARGGADLFKLVRETARAGLAGLEHVYDIPATVGGAVRMNAGGQYGTISDCLESVSLMRATGEVETLPAARIAFGYRRTDIAAPLIVEAAFALERADPAATSERMKSIFAQKKQSQPFGDRSAGCAFKNPVDQTDKGAGRLIDEAGLKGKTHGTAKVSELHANFLLADRETGRAEDVYQLMLDIERAVKAHHGIALEREVVVWP